MPRNLYINNHPEVNLMTSQTTTPEAQDVYVTTGNSGSGDICIRTPGDSRHCSKGEMIPACNQPTQHPFIHHLLIWSACMGYRDK